MSEPIARPSPRLWHPWGRYFAVVGLVLVTGLIWHFGLRNLAGLMLDASWGGLALTSVLFAAGYWIRAWKWHYALGRGQQGLFLFFLAKTAGNWTPGRAGELAPLLIRRHRNARVAAWIGLDRVVEVAWTLGLGLLGAASVGLVPWWVVVLLAGAGTVGLSLGWHGLTRGWLRFRVRKGDPEPSTLRARVDRFAGTIRRELMRFGGKMPIIMASTALAKVTDVYAVILLCRAFGYDASFLLVSAARCAHALVSAVPVTPDATGVPFLAAAWCLHTYADIPYDTLTVALALEVVVINGILWACFCIVSVWPWKDRGGT